MTSSVSGKSRDAHTFYALHLAWDRSSAHVRQRIPASLGVVTQWLLRPWWCLPSRSHLDPGTVFAAEQHPDPI